MCVCVQGGGRKDPLIMADDGDVVAEVSLYELSAEVVAVMALVIQRLLSGAGCLPSH